MYDIMMFEEVLHVPHMEKICGSRMRIYFNTCTIQVVICYICEPCRMLAKKCTFCMP